MANNTAAMPLYSFVYQDGTAGVPSLVSPAARARVERFVHSGLKL